MKALRRLKITKWHVLCVFMILATCLVCRSVSAQESAAKTKIFLVGEMKRPAPQQSPVLETAQRMRPTVRASASLPFYINALQYISEKQGKIPVVSGMDGKFQLEFGLFGYLGLKYSF